MITGQRTVIVVWACQLIAAAILAQTLFFKLSGAPESVYIFTALGIEPWGRIGSAIAEMVAVVLMLIPRTAGLGALLGLGIISAAVMSHLTRLGIVVQDDGGLLFGLALATMVCCATVVFIRRRSLVQIVRNLHAAAVRQPARP